MSRFLAVLAERGVDLREVSFPDLVIAREAASKRGASALIPMFTPHRGAVGAAFVAGELSSPSLIGAVVLRNCPAGLRCAIHDLTLFGDTRIEGMRAGITGDTSLIDGVSGLVAVIGAIWRDPDAPKGMLRPLWPVLVEAALQDERVGWIVGLIRRDNHPWIGFTIEGFRHSWEYLSYSDPEWNAGKLADDLVICAMSRMEAEQRVLRSADATTRHISAPTPVAAPEAHAGASLSTAPLTG
ncbi:MAG: hypothetical protein JWO51_188 [Rhodospirillales bacterium]|nr:hypothetical protein [Rhodospirillales bacterium]